MKKTCTEIAGNQTDREQILECILTIVDNETNKKICINFYFAKVCAKIAKDMKNNSIKECQLFFFYDGSEYEIDFDIMNIDSKYSYINILFYSVWHNCENEIIKVLTDDDGIDVKNITVYFYTRANF